VTDGQTDRRTDHARPRQHGGTGGIAERFQPPKQLNVDLLDLYTVHQCNHRRAGAVVM